jgi:hypothetical protein
MNLVNSGLVPSEVLSDYILFEMYIQNEKSIKWGQIWNIHFLIKDKQLHPLENEFITERNFVGLRPTEQIGQE